MWDELKTMESEFPYLELAKLKKEYKEELAQQKNKNGISGYRVR
jgi:hypothetical protein